MRPGLVALVISLVFIASCDRRPVQKDLPLGNTMQRGEHQELESSTGAADAPFELQFIDTLIAHDLASIDAAQLVATRTAHPELKKFVALMIVERQEEIARLRELRSQSYADSSAAVNLDLPGMREGMDMDYDKLDLLKDKAFDTEFLREMIPHQEGAIKLAQDALGRETSPEVRMVADVLVKGQGSELEQMKEWQRKW